MGSGRSGGWWWRRTKSLSENISFPFSLISSLAHSMFYWKIIKKLVRLMPECCKEASLSSSYSLYQFGYIFIEYYSMDPRRAFSLFIRISSGIIHGLFSIQFLSSTFRKVFLCSFSRCEKSFDVKRQDWDKELRHLVVELDGNQRGGKLNLIWTPRRHYFSSFISYLKHRLERTARQQ